MAEHTKGTATGSKPEPEKRRSLDFFKLEKLTLDSVNGKLSPIEISEFNNLLGQVTGELNTAQNPEEIERFKARLEVLYSKLHTA